MEGKTNKLEEGLKNLDETLEHWGEISRRWTGISTKNLITYPALDRQYESDHLHAFKERAAFHFLDFMPFLAFLDR